MHVPRYQNTKADVVSKLASTRMHDIDNSFIQETLGGPSIPTSAIVAVVTTGVSKLSWTTLIMTKNEHIILPADLVEVVEYGYTRAFPTGPKVVEVSHCGGRLLN
ncbi:hypothetical protein KIW84_032070 [Lathyrus oleraceus]|uniref:RNase H type-1 domain-containing protein n=1 Tax=Pisum sativum TaxID=3888 RepID=A0A9D4XS77_PEA|nr:hypothetical protein KIW84_032070 [Pisum sativum]